MPDTLLAGRRILFVVPPTRFDEAEFYQTWQLLAEEGAWLTTAAETPTGIAAGENGASERIALRLEKVEARDFDGVVLIEGGEGPDAVLDRAQRAVATAVAAGIPVAAFGKLGDALVDAGVPVIQGYRHALPRLVAELALRVSRSGPTHRAPPRVEAQ